MPHAVSKYVQNLHVSHVRRAVAASLHPSTFTSHIIIAPCSAPFYFLPSSSSGSWSGHLRLPQGMSVRSSDPCSDSHVTQTKSNPTRTSSVPISLHPPLSVLLPHVHLPQGRPSWPVLFPSLPCAALPCPTLSAGPVSSRPSRCNVCTHSSLLPALGFPLPFVAIARHLARPSIPSLSSPVRWAFCEQ